MKHSEDKLGRLVIECDDRAFLREIADERGDSFDSDETMYDLFERIVANSELEWIDPADTGDLTSAPMLGITDENERVWKRWAFMDYQITSPQRQLLDTGRCVWEGGR